MLFKVHRFSSILQFMIRYLVSICLCLFSMQTVSTLKLSHLFTLAINHRCNFCMQKTLHLVLLLNKSREQLMTSSESLAILVAFGSALWVLRPIWSVHTLNYPSRKKLLENYSNKTKKTKKWGGLVLSTKSNFCLTWDLIQSTRSCWSKVFQFWIRSSTFWISLLVFESSKVQLSKQIYLLILTKLENPNFH
jgi:heme/copper-type cytochrome/quinol oxidase subunit 4